MHSLFITTNRLLLISIGFLLSTSPVSNAFIIHSDQLRFPTASNETFFLPGSGLNNPDLQLYVNLCDLVTSQCYNNITILNATDYAIAITVPTSVPTSLYGVQVCDKNTNNCVTAPNLNFPIIDWFISENYPDLTKEGIVVQNDTVHFFGTNLLYINGYCTSFQALPTSSGNDRDTTDSFSVRNGGKNVSYVQNPGSLLVRNDNFPDKIPAVQLVPVKTSTDDHRQPLTIDLLINSISCNRADIFIPDYVTPGTYQISIDNGLVPDFYINTPVQITVEANHPNPWPTTNYTIGTTTGCSTVALCVQTCVQQGGGVIYVPSGIYNMESNVMLTLTNYCHLTALEPSTTDQPILRWFDNIIPPPSTLLTCSGNGKLSYLTLQAYSPVSALTSFTNSETYCSIENSNLIINYTNPLVPVRNAFVTSNATGWRFVNNTIYHQGNCSSSWPYNCAISFHVSQYSVFSGNYVNAVCQGYSGDTIHHFMWDRNTFVSTGNNSQGDGFNTFSNPHIVQYLYFGRSIDIGNPYAGKRWESMTFDGPGSVILSRIGTVINSSSFTLMDPPYDLGLTYPGLLVSVMQGTGLGQIRQLQSFSINPSDNSSSVWTVDTPFDTPLIPEDSVVSIVPFRGDIIFEGNTYINGTTFQFFGTAVRISTAGTYMNNMPNMIAWGREYQGGYQINQNLYWGNNIMVCGPHGRIGSISDDEASPVPPFPFQNKVYNYLQVYRNNSLFAGAGMEMNGQTWSSIVEQNTYWNGTCVDGTYVAAGNLEVNETSTQMIIVR